MPEHTTEQVNGINMMVGILEIPQIVFNFLAVLRFCRGNLLRCPIQEYLLQRTQPTLTFLKSRHVETHASAGEGRTVARVPSTQILSVNSRMNIIVT